MSLKGAFYEKFLPATETSVEFQENMATCNSLTYIRGEIQGDPQELAIFQSTYWKTIETEHR